MIPKTKNYLIKSMVIGGETGIRTLGRRKPTSVFETDAFDHSATSPQQGRGGGFSCWGAGLQALFGGNLAKT